MFTFVRNLETYSELVRKAIATLLVLLREDEFKNKLLWECCVVYVLVCFLT